ncbi:MAG TPA: hypothetical protein VGO52_15860 [Hyphomonadaceae bacterium]|nr:hypothetical protein [Hyphomonadaceae bacterium]
MLTRVLVLAVLTMGLTMGLALSAASEKPAKLPPALIGKWGFAVATGDYCGPNLSNCAPGSGGGVSLVLKEDGGAELEVFESALVDGCGSIRTMTTQRGFAEVKGAKLIFRPASGAYSAVNGCRPDLTGVWRLPASDLKPISVGWRLEPDPMSHARKLLRISDPQGQISGDYSRRP